MAWFLLNNINTKVFFDKVTLFLFTIKHFFIMKNLFSIILLLSLFSFVSCEKEEVDAEPSAQVDLGVFRVTQDPTSGKFSKTPAQSTIWMWRSDNREFDVTASGTEVYLGRLYDNKTKTYVSADYGAIGVIMTETIRPGKYFVYVMLNKSDQPGSQAYSYTQVEIGADQKFKFTKTFSSNVGNLQYEAWEKNQ